MNADDALVTITIIGSAGTLANVWLTLSIRNSILGLKLWTRENFVAKEDLPQYLQYAESKNRIAREGAHARS